MKLLCSNNTSSTENFELWENEKFLANISFSNQTRFVRIVSDIGKRMFSFENKGFFTPKKVIRNEYGVKLGKIEEEKGGTGKGSIELNGKKYFFAYNQGNSGELVLYDESQQKNRLTCSINALTLGVSKTKSFLDSRFASLLFVLCWYSFQPNDSTITEAVI